MYSGQCIKGLNGRIFSSVKWTIRSRSSVGRFLMVNERGRVSSPKLCSGVESREVMVFMSVVNAFVEIG